MTVLTHWEGRSVLEWADVLTVPAVEAHDVIGSTNDRARALAAEGAAPFTVVVADEQRAGRGRSGDAWHSPPGSGLWSSTVLPAPAAPTLPLLVGLAAARAIASLCPRLRVGIKWPNDLEIEGRKVGGILCEQAQRAVVAGVGLNVRQRAEDFPEAIRAHATSLQASGCAPVELGALAGALLAELRALCGTPAPETLPGPLLAELGARDVLAGRRIRTQQAGEGVARGIDAGGALVLEREGGERVRVVAGSVRTL